VVIGKGGDGAGWDQQSGLGTGKKGGDQEVDHCFVVYGWYVSQER
jgi:hypothetical protein